ncbi:hypothetical protein LCGC14_0804820 [marine sediment metagenome]|uniref:Uncharacterized protein n=1 Tax=marine sediment metagenome TaxID=412755 RepID=A0A0F9PT32_9ZZZZ
MLPIEEKNIKCKDCNFHGVPISKDAFYCYNCVYNPLGTETPMSDRRNFNTRESNLVAIATKKSFERALKRAKDPKEVARLTGEMNKIKFRKVK